MKGFLAGKKRYRDFFTALDPNTDTKSVLRTRSLPLLHLFKTNKDEVWLWTTFGPDQVDLNFKNPAVLIEIIDVMLFYAKQGASVVRLDAIPYLWKKLGTSCAHLPETHEIIKLIRDFFDAAMPHMIILTETNVPHEDNIKYLGNRGDEAQMIYNFCLPPLILFSLYKGNATKLTAWAKTVKPISPEATFLNITATHDGIGMRPTEGLLSEDERRELMVLAELHNGGVTGKRNSDGTISPYELNLNYFDAVNNPASTESIELQINRFMVSQAIVASFMGIPGVYIQSLLGSRNDTEGVKRTGRLRTINRQQHDIKVLTKELNDPSSLRHKVFTRLTRLLKIRKSERAFHPDASQEILILDTKVFAVKRINKKTKSTIIALHNVSDKTVKISRTKLNTTGKLIDILSNKTFTPSDEAITLKPYECLWLK
jgi:sucrose phosphorylase